MLPRVISSLLLASTLPILAACAAGPAAPEAAPVVATIIVKPRAPSSAESVLRLAQGALGRDAGVRYVRLMAGDAHLLHLTGPATRDQVPALVDRLRASNAFQYVELDSMMKIQ